MKFCCEMQHILCYRPIRFCMFCLIGAVVKLTSTTHETHELEWKETTLCESGLAEFHTFSFT